MPPASLGNLVTRPARGWATRASRAGQPAPGSRSGSGQHEERHRAVTRQRQPGNLALPGRANRGPRGDPAATPASPDARLTRPPSRTRRRRHIPDVADGHPLPRQTGHRRRRPASRQCPPSPRLTLRSRLRLSPRHAGTRRRRTRRLTTSGLESPSLRPKAPAWPSSAGSGTTDDKLVVVQSGYRPSDEEILAAVAFQEIPGQHHLIRAPAAPA